MAKTESNKKKVCFAPEIIITKIPSEEEHSVDEEHKVKPVEPSRRKSSAGSTVLPLHSENVIPSSSKHDDEEKRKLELSRILVEHERDIRLEEIRRKVHEKVKNQGHHSKSSFTWDSDNLDPDPVLYTAQHLVVTKETKKAVEVVKDMTRKQLDNAMTPEGSRKGSDSSQVETLTVAEAEEKIPEQQIAKNELEKRKEANVEQTTKPKRRFSIFSAKK